MNNLTSYIFDNICKIDGHIHLFDKKEFLGDLYESPKKHCVCFGDYSIRHIDEYIGKMKNYYNSIRNLTNTKLSLMYYLKPGKERTVN